MESWGWHFHNAVSVDSVLPYSHANRPYSILEAACSVLGNKTMKEDHKLKRKTRSQQQSQSEKKKAPWYRRLPIAHAAYGAFLGSMAFLASTLPVFAGEDGGDAGVNVWTKANEIMKDVYSQILLISTVAAIVTASVALLMMNFSRSGRTVDESRAWLKRICITWAVLNGLGFIMAYVTPFFSGGKWGG